MCLSIFLWSHDVFAASINVVSSSRAGVYDVVLYMAKHESINAVEGTVLFSESIKAIPKIETADSIIPLWVKQPTVSGSSVNFSGIIPGGFSVLYDQFGGQPKSYGKLFSIAFPFAKNVKSYIFTLDSTYLYPNDGRGTRIIIPYKNITLPVSTDKNDFPFNTDTTPSPASNNSPIIFLLFIIVLFCLYAYFT